MEKTNKSVGNSTGRSGRGRPCDPERWRRIIDVARSHFDAHGLMQANVDAIAAEARVSKMTIYKHFASKNGLFEAVVRERTRLVVGGIAGLGSLDPARPADALLLVGAHFLALSRDEATLGQCRSLYGAAHSQPDACKAFYRQGAGRLVADLAAYLQRAQDAGALAINRPTLAADLFFAMFLGEGHMRGLLKLDTPTDADNQALLKEAVRVFLCAYERRC